MASSDLAPLPQLPADRDSLFVAWARGRQQEERRRLLLLQGLQAQPDPSEAADIRGPITAWAEGLPAISAAMPTPSPSCAAAEPLPLAPARPTLRPLTMKKPPRSGGQGSHGYQRCDGPRRLTPPIRRRNTW